MISLVLWLCQCHQMSGSGSDFQRSFTSFRMTSLASVILNAAKNLSLSLRADSAKNLAVKAVRSEILRCPRRGVYPERSRRSQGKDDDSWLAVKMTHYQRSVVSY